MRHHESLDFRRLDPILRSVAIRKSPPTEEILYRAR